MTAAGALSALLTRPVVAAERSIAAPPIDPMGELDRLASALKAAVASGAMSEDEAKSVYMAMAERLSGGLVAKSDGAPNRGAPPDITLPAPSPGQIRVLLRPDFLRRDLAVLQRDLELDPDQASIVGVLLEQYGEAFDLAATPFREAMDRFRRSATDAWLVGVLDRVDLPPPAQAEDAIRRTARRWAAEPAAGADAAPTTPAAPGKQDRSEEMTRRMLEAASTMEERLRGLRRRIATERAGMDEADVTAADLVGMARQFRADRTVLRAELVELVGLVLTERQLGEDGVALRTAKNWIQVERGRASGRFSGESMDLRASLAEARDGSRDSSVTVAALDRIVPGIAAVVEARTAAILDREIAGIAGLDPRAWRGGSLGAGGSFDEAVSREITASIAVRDATMAALRTLDDAPEAEAFRTAALRRGFPAEMQVRWCERALATAGSLPDAPEPLRAAIEDLRAFVDTELRALRAEAVAGRVELESRLARARAEAALDAGEVKAAYGAELWFGMGRDAFRALDDEIAARLAGMLSAEQLAVLPARARSGGLAGAAPGEHESAAKQDAAGGSKPATSGKPVTPGKPVTLDRPG